ncbi:hypothetical protein ACLB2K_047046 [Fragaria x ananassa]
MEPWRSTWRLASARGGACAGGRSATDGGDRMCGGDALEDLAALPCALDFQISASMATAEIEGWSRLEVSLPVQCSVFWVAKKAIGFSAGPRPVRPPSEHGPALGLVFLGYGLQAQSGFLVVLNTGGLCSGKCMQCAMFALMRRRVLCVVKWSQPPSGRMKLRATGNFQ